MEYLSVKEKQEASLDALLYVHEFCKEHGLSYYLAYGTLIGAIRHNGFIPWDDDVDIHLPRPDYERFLKEFNDPTGHYKLYSCFNNKDYLFPYAKVENMKTARILPNGAVGEDGIGIDLFPLDGLPADLQKAEALFKQEDEKFKKIVLRFDRLRRTNPASLKDVIKLVVGKVCDFSGYLRKTAQRISGSPYIEEYDDCEKVATVVGIYSGNFRAFEKSWFEPVDLNFEGHLLIGPKGYDQILRLVYGDYMQLPPEEERVTTHTDKFIWQS